MGVGKLRFRGQLAVLDFKTGILNYCLDKDF